MAMVKELSEFLRVHGILLASAGLPPSLHEQLFRKLSGEVFDGGEFFQIELCEGGLQRRLLLSAQSLPQYSQVFLVDHAWSFRLTEARKQLEENPALAERLSILMCVGDQSVNSNVATVPEDDIVGSPKNESCLEAVMLKAKQKAKEAGELVSWLELDDLGIDDAVLASLDLPSEFPDLVGLSLWGNKLESMDVILQTITRLKNLRALWLNANPIAKKEDTNLEAAILAALPNLEIYNSKFTENYSSWAVARCSCASDENLPLVLHASEDEVLRNTKALDLSARNIRSLSKKVFNPVQLPMLTHLSLCGNPLDQDAQSELFDVLRSLVNLQSLEVDIPGPLGRYAVEIVDCLPNLCILNDVDVAEILEEEKEIIVSNLKPRLPMWSPDEPLSECVLRAMWTFLLTYRLADEEKLDETPIWYIMDELGSALRHSDKPNFRIAPFLFMPNGRLDSAISYSLIWPVKDVHKGEECTRDYLFGIGEDKQRSARLTAWFHCPMQYFQQVYKKKVERLEKCCPKISVVNGNPMQSILSNEWRSLIVYTDIPQVEETLTRPEFKLSDDPSQADIIWTSTQIDEELKNALGLKDYVYTNQFPYEACLVMKHHLAQTVQQAYGCPVWFPTTYNMESELAELIGDYSLREKQGKNSLWILKPWNMARTIDTSISGYLPAIIRLMETGPKICQKYIEQPALFCGKKFDLRYIVLLRSIQPLEVFLFDVFWIRLANKQYKLDESSLTDYETHFTVMNYGRAMRHINMHEFVPEFEKEHSVKWSDIHSAVRKMIRCLFTGAASVHPEMHCPTARAIYGVDVMLDSNMQPKLLEVTYCPDCERACKYDVQKVLGDGELVHGSDFFNDVFGCLFLNSYKNMSPL